jgi:serine/threonine protein kinase
VLCKYADVERYKFIVTEFMDGKSLEALIHGKKQLNERGLHHAVSFSKKVELLLEMLRGLVYMHARQPPLLHRDLKPS